MRLLEPNFPRLNIRWRVALPGSCQQMWRLRMGQESGTANHITKAIYSFLPHRSISMPRHGAQIALQLEAEIVSTRRESFLWIQSSSITEDLLGDRLKCFALSKAAGRFKMLLFQLFWLQALWRRRLCFTTIGNNGVKVFQLGTKLVESEWPRTKWRKAVLTEEFSLTSLTVDELICWYIFAFFFLLQQAWWQWRTSHCCL